MKKKYKYERVTEELRERITAGVWGESGSFPTELQLAREYAVCHLTIRKALDVLISEGIIVRQRGRGTFINEAHLADASSKRLLYVGNVNADFYKELYLALGQASSRLGLRLESIHGVANKTGHVDVGFSESAMNKMLRNVQTVMCNHDTAEQLLPLIRQHGSHLVILDLYHRDYPEFPGHVITADLFRATRLATDHLAACGHRDIAFIGAPDCAVAGKPFHRPALDRLSLQGYRASLAMVGVEVQRKLEVGVRGVLVEECEPILAAWLKALPVWPTAFVCDGDFRAAALVRVAASLRKRCPRDFSIISTGNTPWCGMSTPALTSVYMGEREMAELSVVLAAHGGLVEPVGFEVAPRLILRESVKSRK